MRLWLGPLIVCVVFALGAHFTTLYVTPGVIMNRAMGELAKRGVKESAFTSPRRITPQTQAVVRSSPDLFYSLCRYDLSDPKSFYRIVMSEWPDYQSVSFFDGNTNNFATVRGAGEEIVVNLGPPGSDSELASPTAKGVILIRRLAPSKEAFEAASKASEGDLCVKTTFGEMR